MAGENQGRGFPSGQCRPASRQLETRGGSLSTIVWSNDGGINARRDPDRFLEAFGTQAAVARADVRQALKAWEQVIVNFNYSHAGQNQYAPFPNTFSFSIQATNLGAELGTISAVNELVDRSGNDQVGKAGDAIGKFGKPFSAILYVDDNGGGLGWYFDPHPEDNAEFKQVDSPFSARGALGGRQDFYTTVLREIGKGLGIDVDAFKTPFALQASQIGFDPVSPGPTKELLYSLAFLPRGSGDPQYVIFTQALRDRSLRRAQAAGCPQFRPDRHQRSLQQRPAGEYPAAHQRPRRRPARGRLQHHPERSRRTRGRPPKSWSPRRPSPIPPTSG